jgi:hypothetical protein
VLLDTAIDVGLVPFAAAAIVTIVARRMRVAPPVVWATGVAFGYVAAQLATASRSGASVALFSLLKPREAVEWLPHAVLLALVVTVLLAYARRPRPRPIIALAAALSIGVPFRLLAGSVYDLRWSVNEKLAYISLLSAIFGLTWLVLASAREDDHPRLRPLLLALVAVGAAAVLALSGVLIYGALCVGAAAALAASFVFAVNSRVDGAAGPVTFSVGGLIVLGYFYAELTLANAALLFLAMMLATAGTPRLACRASVSDTRNSAVSEKLPLRSRGLITARPAWTQRLLRIGLVLIPLSIALTQAILTAQAVMSSSPY